MNRGALRERILYRLVSLVLLLALAVMVWTVVLKERESRRVLLQFEAHRALTALTDLVRARTIRDSDLEGILAFGLYDERGASLYSYGSAPAALPASGQAAQNQEFNRFILQEDKLVMIRILGSDILGRRVTGMMGMQRGLRVLPENMAERMPLYAYIEYSLGSYRQRQALLMAFAIGASTILAILYALFSVLFNRYDTYRTEELETRELVALGEAARTIVHEIKNPLSVMRIQCGLLRKNAPEETGPSIAIIEDEVDRMASMADRIRIFLKGGNEGREDLAVAPFLAALSSRYGDRLSCLVEVSESARVGLGADKLKDTLDNLIANAFEAQAHAPDGGVPVLRARETRKTVLLELADSGPGVPPESRPRLFEPFFTTKERGTGLGLALARKNAREAGGDIAYQERPGGGALFIVSLPKL